MFSAEINKERRANLKNKINQGIFLFWGNEEARITHPRPKEHKPDSQSLTNS